MKLTQQTTGRFPVNASWIGGTAGSGSTARPPIRIRGLLATIIVAGIGFLPHSVRAQTPTVLANFGYYVTGATPQGGVIAGPDGNLYGTAGAAGASGGGGTIFQFKKSTGAFTVLSTMAPIDLRGPIGNLVFDPSGNIIGAASGSRLPSGGLFQYSFSNNLLTEIAGGMAPQGGLTTDSSGVIYGVDTGQLPLGISDPSIFKISGPNHVVTTVASMPGRTLNLSSSVIIDTAGNFYGTTENGGTAGKGSIFRVDAITHQTATIYSFTGSDGVSPMGGLTIDNAGNLYGTTMQGGPDASFSNGTVFEWFASTGSLTTLASFRVNGPGELPLGPVTLDTNGDIFGTTSADASDPSVRGSVFEIDSQTHALTTLAKFNGLDGDKPTGALLLQDGMLYGTTAFGGLNNQGVLYELAVPEPASIALVIPFSGLLIQKRRLASC